MVRLIPQVAPISPQRRMKRSWEVRGCWAGVGLGSAAGDGGASVAVAMVSPVSVFTESIASRSVLSAVSDLSALLKIGLNTKTRRHEGQLVSRSTSADRTVESDFSNARGAELR